MNRSGKVTLKQNGKGAMVVCGPATEVIPGARFTVDGRTVEIRSVGKPFDSNGTKYVYGYLTGGQGPRHIGSSLAEMFR